MSSISAQSCCVVGGGPAGTVLALLLARQSLNVTLLEAHDTFDRDLRGDSVHPSTQELLDHLGLLDDVNKLTNVRGYDVPIHFPTGRSRHRFGGSLGRGSKTPSRCLRRRS
jgi:2-polyprenyl-6-methoxyphenol hydroxylase-like FAD-dependent oxidoreductase